MRLLKVVGYDIRDFFTSLLTYVFLFFTIAPPVGILIASKFVDNITTSGYILSFAFASFGSMFVVISAVRVFTKDISENTNMLFMNSKKNRTTYALSKIVSMGVIGFIYGIILVIILMIAKFMGANLLEASVITPANHKTVIHLLSEIVLSYTVISLVFGTIYFFFSLFIRSSVFVFVLAVLVFLFYDLVESLGGLAYAALLDKDQQPFVDFLRDYFPFSSATSGLSEVSITNPHFLMLGVYLIVFIFLIILRIRKRDY